MLFLGLNLFWPQFALALTPGSLVYRTSSDGKMYGYSGDNLIAEDANGILRHIYPGHAGIYIGQENGEDYIIEALAGGIVKTQARYFVNEALEEKLLGAKLPIKASNLERAKAIKIAKSLVGKNLGYDFDFKKQKGPDNNEWTCVGLTEKVYESAGISNPNNLGALEYNPDYYAVNITPDGFDNQSLANSDGDCFSKTLEFSKIERRMDLRLPLPEIVGFNAGFEYQGERYIFLPYTQFLQPSLKNENIDIDLETFFTDETIRGKTPGVILLLRWSFVNNPISSLKVITNQVAASIISLKDKIFGSKKETQIVIEDENLAIEDDLKTDETAVENNSNLPKININQAVVNNTEKDDGTGSLAELKKEVIKVPEQLVKITSTATVSTTDSSKLTQPALKVVPVTTSIPKSVTASNASLAVRAAVPKLISSVSPSVANLTKSASVSAAANSKINAGVKTAEKKTSTSTNEVPSSTNSSFNLPTSLINKIYSTENNDFIELYNSTNYDFDLAEAGFRLEKAKTANDPSLMIRIGNPADGYYPGGTIIKAKGYYLIVRDDANSYYKNMADAIAIRNDFSWTDSGYIIYLGKAAISSSSDEDIVDAVGFGEATYFQGLGPAAVINDNYILNRIKSTGNNISDFNLIISDDPDIVWEENNNSDDTNNTTDPNNNDSNEQSNNDLENPVNPDLFVVPLPLNSQGISDVYHFDECYGNNNFSVGRFGCAVDIGLNNPKFSEVLTANVNLNQFSLGFYYRSPKLSYATSRISFKLKNDGGQELNIMLDEGMLQIEGLPNSEWRYYNTDVFPDNAWHYFALVVDKEAGYWSIDLDGVEKYRHLFVQTLVDNFSNFEITLVCLSMVSSYNLLLAISSCKF